MMEEMPIGFEYETELKPKAKAPAAKTKPPAKTPAK
jgi:hypothetical protein